jgi:hypothetical protein
MNLNFRRHYYLIVWLILITITLILGMGDQRIVAYTLQGSESLAAQGIYLARLAEWLSALDMH